MALVLDFQNNGSASYYSNSKIALLLDGDFLARYIFAFFGGNGGLTEVLPGGEEANGARRYSYNAAGFLVAVEAHDGSSWTPQAQMAYDGLGQRLSMTGFAGGQSVTTQYVMDGSRVLSADADGNLTTYLYGLGPIGQLTDVWAYGLPDGSGTQRQLVDPQGGITLAASYTPSPYRVLHEGDALSVSGEGNFTFGYFGGIMDTATGLLYVGNGQYYDSSTGRFLNRNLNLGSANPYVPVPPSGMLREGGEPTGALIALLVLLAMLYSRKKRRGKLDTLIILLVLCVGNGMSLAACGPDTPQGESSPTSEPRSTQSNQDNNAPTQPPVSGTPGGETDKGSNPGNPGSGNNDPSADSTVKCYVTPTPDPTPTSTPTARPNPLPSQKLKDLFGVELINGNLTWSSINMEIALKAVEDIANRMGSAATFRFKFSTNGLLLKLVMGTSAPGINLSDECKIIGAGGCTTNSHTINFASLSPYNGGLTARNNIVHELGHAFNNGRNKNPSESMPGDYVSKRNEILRANETFSWQLHIDNSSSSETFADFFVAWTYDAWQPPIDSMGNLTLAGEARNWMIANMATNW